MGVDNPSSVAVGGNGRAYVTDTHNSRLQEFTATGGFFRTWGTEGSANAQFTAPQGAAVGSNSHVTVTDTGNSRIQEFTATGCFVRTWGSEGSGNG